MVYIHQFPTDVDVRSISSERKSRDDHSFDHDMRIALHQVTVLKSAGLAFVGVANEVARHAFGLGDKAPFHSRRKSCSSSTAQAALLHFLHYICIAHLQRFL